MPPPAVKVPAYAVPFVPPGNDDVAIVNAGAATVIERGSALVCAGLPESLTVTVKLVVPLVVGVPEINPVFGDRVSPAGSAPPVTDQV